MRWSWNCLRDLVNSMRMSTKSSFPSPVWDRSSLDLFLSARKSFPTYTSSVIVNYNTIVHRLHISTQHGIYLFHLQILSRLSIFIRRCCCVNILCNWTGLMWPGVSCGCVAGTGWRTSSSRSPAPGELYRGRGHGHRGHGARRGARGHGLEILRSILSAATTLLQS